MSPFETVQIILKLVRNLLEATALRGAPFVLSRAGRLIVRIATDVGGTFTDLVYFEPRASGGALVKAVKVDTTSPAFEQGVLSAMRLAEVKEPDIGFFAHGSTVVINALLSRAGATTGLVTTRGFRDVLEIARSNRPDIFNFLYRKPAPFVPRHLRQEISERMAHDGSVIEPVALDELRTIVKYFKQQQVRSVAVCLLHSYANPAHEIAIKQRLSEIAPELCVIASHEIIREWREYERASTTVLSAYVKPVADAYLSNLEGALGKAGLDAPIYVMQSNGGIDTLATARRCPISMVESGPASGVLGAAALGKLIGEENLIALDIGGTTAKCALIEKGRALTTTQYFIERSASSAGYPIRTPVVDIVEIGNGGGSIAWIDEAGKLKVGPHSAGAIPGPAAYGRGGNQPTTTDANLLTGRIDSGYFFGGRIDADVDSATRALSAIGDKLDLPAADVARGIIRIANNNMINALKLVSVNRGYDPRNFVLIAFGGGGPMHAAALARELQIPKVIVPRNSAVFSAWGMLMSDLRRDYLLTRITPLQSSSISQIRSTYSELAAAAIEAFAEEGFSARSVIVQYQADLRYEGQEHTVKIAFPNELSALEPEAVRELFAAEYRREYSYVLPNDIELVNYHLVASVPVEKPTIEPLAITGAPLKSALRGRRRIDFDEDGCLDAPAYDRARLEPSMRIHGPAAIDEPDTVTLVWPGQLATIDAFGNIHISLA